MRKILARAVVVASLVAFVLAPTTGCSRGMANFLAGALIVTAAVAIVAHHDAHYHDPWCGHERVYVEDRDVYYYEGQWEYYDQDSGQWYYYTEPPVQEHHHYYYP